MMQHVVCTTKDLLHKLSETARNGDGLVTCGCPSLPGSGLTSGLRKRSKGNPQVLDNCIGNKRKVGLHTVVFAPEVDLFTNR